MNLDSARQSQIEELPSERGGPSPRGKSDEEDRFGELAGSPNSPNLTERRITSEGTLYAYFNGGCTFEGSFSNCRTLASFADLPGQPPAIIECLVGKGKAILSGVHLEVSAAELDAKDPFLQPLIPLLESSEHIRKKFWDRLILYSSTALSNSSS